MTRFLLSLLLLLGTELVSAESWPTYRHDNRRSGVTSEAPELPLLPLWQREAAQAPQMAWTGPAKWDAYSGNSGLQSMRNFDPCYYVTAGGGLVFFGSSVDDAVHALDATTGEERWIHFASAPVRFPPTLWEDLALAGSDDGSVFCLDQSSGKVIWRKRAAPSDRRIPSNRKLISTHPVRTGVLIREERAYFAASLVPWQPSILWAVEARTGEERSAGCYRAEVKGVTLQGALLASPDHLYIPQGRAAPLAFDRHTGDAKGSIGEAGGVFCLLTEDEMLLAGPQNQKASESEIRIADGTSRKRLATFSGTERILVSGDRAWMPMKGRLRLLDRKVFVEHQITIDAAHAAAGAAKKAKDPEAQKRAESEAAVAVEKQKAAWIWSIESGRPHTMILAGETLFLGLANRVVARDAGSGEILWEAEVKGDAHGLAFAEGRLLVSTGLGHLFAFGSPDKD